MPVFSLSEREYVRKLLRLPADGFTHTLISRTWPLANITPPIGSPTNGGVLSRLEEGGREGASVRMAKVRERSSRGGEEEDEEVYGGERERERER